MCFVLAVFFPFDADFCSCVKMQTPIFGEALNRRQTVLTAITYGQQGSRAVKHCDTDNETTDFKKPQKRMFKVLSGQLIPTVSPNWLKSYTL